MKTAKELELNLLVKEAHIQQLKLEIEKLNEEIMQMRKLYFDLKDRIDKAIEYIYLHSTQRKFFFDKIERQLNGKPNFYGDVSDLLEILKGEDNDN